MEAVFLIQSEVQKISLFTFIYSASYGWAMMLILCLSTGTASSQSKASLNFDHVAAEIKRDPQKSSVSFISMKENYFMDLTAAEKWLQDSVLAASIDDKLVAYQATTDKIGMVHHRYGQYYKGTRVEGGTYYIHAKDGKMVSANGDFFPGINVNVMPAIPRSQALNTAKTFFNAKSYDPSTDHSGNGQLVILYKDNRYSLCWKFEISALAEDRKSFVYVDAVVDSVLKELTLIFNSTGTAVTHYNGIKNITTDSTGINSFRLRDYSRGMGITTLNIRHATQYLSAIDFTDTDNYWDDTTNFDDAATDVHFVLGATYDYYLSKFGQNGYDSLGSGVTSYVHYNTNYNNASWAGGTMRFGDGDGVNYNPFTSAEIIAHEFTHGVTQFSANLEYQYESGALNESFSDIFGVTIDFWLHSGTTADWKMGEQCSISGTGFRNMSTPNEFMHPDTYDGDYWYTGSADNHGVHTNSGVQNFWYYLLVNGGSGTNDIGSSYSVNGIGFDDAIDIAYRTLTVYLTEQSEYTDASEYSIQAAIDLFGLCSPQVRAVTNAWFAVGIGSEFTTGATVSFSTSGQICNPPQSITFSASGTNAASWNWDFGDGNNSVLEDPVHTYDSAGSYTVTVTVTGNGICSDAFKTIENGITIIDTLPPGASCYPFTTTPSNYIGTRNIRLSNLNASSAASYQGNKIPDCNIKNITALYAGGTDSIFISTSNNYDENVKVWIDYNNDAAFDSSECIFTSGDLQTYHKGLVRYATNPVMNTPLLLRVVDDSTGIAVQGACDTLIYGQSEDYLVVFINDSMPPVADFAATPVLVMEDSSVQFENYSRRAATQLQWFFPGGIPSASTAISPLVTYPSAGYHDVILIASNAFGSDTITRTSYISVMPRLNVCSQSIITTADGVLYDDGGPSGNYSDQVDCMFLVQSPCATFYQLSISGAMEAGHDSLIIMRHDSTVLMALSSSSVSFPNFSFSADAFYVRFVSDGNTNNTGFMITWHAITYSSQPVTAAIGVTAAQVPFFSDVNFTDQSLNAPTAWFWDFGDGATSTLQHPVHRYSTSGLFNVTLIAVGCTSVDTAYLQMIVDDPPVVSWNPASLNISVSCNDSVVVPVVITNTGAGPLVVLPTADANNKIELVLFDYLNYASNPYNYLQYILSQIEDLVNITVVSLPDSALLDSMLQGKDLLLIAAPREDSSADDYTNIAGTVHNFLNAGSNVIACCAIVDSNNYIENLNLFQTDFLQQVFNVPLQVHDRLHPIMKGLPEVIYNGFYQRVHDTDATLLCSYDSNISTVATRKIGQGEAIMIGNYFFFGYLQDYVDILLNTIKYSAKRPLQKWLNISSDPDTIAAGQTDTVYVVFNASGMPQGSYQGQLDLMTNDTNQISISIPCTINVGGAVQLNLSDACIDFDTTMQFTAAADTLYLVNNGCTNIQVDSILFSGTNFMLNDTSALLNHGDSLGIPVQFIPQQQGNFTGVINIFTDAADTSVCLNGFSSPAPVISIDPDTIFVSLAACHDSVVVPITIRNSGFAGLTFHTYHQLVRDTTNILVHQNSEFNSNFSKYTLPANLQSRIPKLSIKSFMGSQFPLDTLDSLFHNNDIVISSNLIYMLSNDSNYRAFKNHIRRGHSYIYFNEYSYLNHPFRIFDYSDASIYGYCIVHVDDTASLITKGLGSEYIMYSPNGSYFVNRDKKKVISANEYDVVSWRPWGAGRNLYVGPLNNPGLDTLFLNAMEWGASNHAASCFPETGNIQTGDSQLVEVTFHNKGLEGGTSIRYLLFHSNDPQHPVDSIPVVMTVDGSPCAAFTDTVSICSDTVRFFDDSMNEPVSWLWDFGDGNTSSDQNPTHWYATPNTYYVSLTACNAAGCNTVTNKLALNSAAGPIAACIPSTSYAQVGIYNFKFGDIDYHSGFSPLRTSAYEDFSCLQSTFVATGTNYPMEVITYRYSIDAETDLEGYIDYNNDGVFDTTELILSRFNSSSPVNNFNVVIPDSGAVQNIPLRLRVFIRQSEYTGQVCTVQNPYGKYEDYTVIITDSITLTNHELKNAGEIMVVPNPSEGMFTFYPVNTEIESITITDMSGRIVDVSKESSIDISKNETGMYFYLIITKDTRRFTGKIIKN